MLKNENNVVISDEPLRGGLVVRVFAVVVIFLSEHSALENPFSNTIKPRMLTIYPSI